VPSLLTGKVDVLMAGLTVTEERRVQIDFAAPYLVVGQGALVRKIEAPAFTTDIKVRSAPVRVAVVEGSAGESLVARYFPNARRTGYSSRDLAVQAMLQNEADMVVHDAPALWWSALRHPDDLAMAPALFAREEIAWGFRRGSVRLRESANDAFADWQRDGTLEDHPPPLDPVFPITTRGRLPAHHRRRPRRPHGRPRRRPASYAPWRSRAGPPARPGAKLAATGGGRGNLSHLATEDEFAAAFGRHGRFTLPAFRSLPPDALCELFAAIGVPTTVDPAGRIYPRSQSAAAVRDALFNACQRAGVRFVFGHRVESLSPPAEPDAPWRVGSFTARAVLLAAGGRSAPRLGSDGSGFDLARSLGYDIVPPVPALTSIRTEESWPATLSGVSLPDVAISIADARGPGNDVRGELLFTHHGLSGPAILNLSGRIARLRHDGLPVHLRLTFMEAPPDFARLRQTTGTRTVMASLADALPRALAGTLLDLSGIPRELTTSRLSSAQEKTLATHLLACPLRRPRHGRLR
jgi:predicted Rossmann fold flavoprotein